MNRVVLPIAAALLLSVALPGFAAETPGHDQGIDQEFLFSPDALSEPYTVDPATASAPPKQVARGTFTPITPPGFKVALFAEVENPRRLLVNTENQVIVAQQMLNSVVLMDDPTLDGRADRMRYVVQGALNPFGLGVVQSGERAGDYLMADQDAVYQLPKFGGGDGFSQLTDTDDFGEPAGHITRDLAVAPDNSFYVAVGSLNNLDTGEPEVKATIQHFSADGKTQTTFASGLRNVTGMAFEPTSGDLYAVVMERDNMGDDLVPDFLTRVQEGDNFGWPYQYIGGHVQPEFRDSAPKLAAAKTPDVLFEAHSAPLDIAFIPEGWPADWVGDALVVLHGSSNAADPRGYKVVRVPFENGRPTGGYVNFMTGFWVSGDTPAEVWGRPSSLAFGPDGVLYVADDLGGTVWSVTPTAAPFAN